jgi:hypothetical protein
LSRHVSGQDELRIVVQPIVLGKGKALFEDVKEWHALTLLVARTLRSGLVRLTYRTGSSVGRLVPSKIHDTMRAANHRGGCGRGGR